MTLSRDIRELIRHAITRCGLGPLHLRLRKLRGQQVDHLFRPTLDARFTAIYEDRVWLNGRNDGSLSGLGSELASTGSVRRLLPGLLKSLETKVLIDVGCGDFTWMKELALDCKYIGIDIVSDVIECNRRSYGAEDRMFRVLDATSAPIPSVSLPDEERRGVQL